MAELTGFKPAEEKSANCIPAGDYPLVVAKCELKPSSNGKFQIIKLEAKVLSGEFQNATIFDQWCFLPLGEKATKIGRGKFARVCEAVGLPEPKSTDELVGKTFIATLKVEKQDGHDDKNSIAKAKPRVAGEAVAAPSGPGKW